MTKRRQKEKYRRYIYFEVKKELPDRCGYRLQDRIRRKVSPSDDSTNVLLLLQHCMDQDFCPIAEIVMNQYNMKQGLKRFGQSGVSAIEKEVCQLVTMDALDPDNPKELSREDLRDSMAYLMFLKEKRDGNIKAQV